MREAARQRYDRLEAAERERERGAQAAPVASAVAASGPAERATTAGQRATSNGGRSAGAGDTAGQNIQQQKVAVRKESTVTSAAVEPKHPEKAALIALKDGHGVSCFFCLSLMLWTKGDVAIFRKLEKRVEEEEGEKEEAGGRGGGGGGCYQCYCVIV